MPRVCYFKTTTVIDANQNVALSQLTTRIGVAEDNLLTKISFQEATSAIALKDDISNVNVKLNLKLDKTTDELRRSNEAVFFESVKNSLYLVDADNVELDYVGLGLCNAPVEVVINPLYVIFDTGFYDGTVLYYQSTGMGIKVGVRWAGNQLRMIWIQDWGSVFTPVNFQSSNTARDIQMVSYISTSNFWVKFHSAELNDYFVMRYTDGEKSIVVSATGNFTSDMLLL